MSRVGESSEAPLLNPSGKKVEAMIIGVQKCGTTSLADWMDRHPSLRLCSQKEPWFFSRHADWRERLESYHALYESAEGSEGADEALWFEASTAYSWFLEHPEVAERLHAYNPGLKLVYIVRDPVERIKSHYRHNVLRGYTRRPFGVEVLADPAYLAHSSYEMQVRPFVERFGREAILFLTFEDLVRDPAEVLGRVFRFLGVETAGVGGAEGFHARNVSGERRRVHPAKNWLAPMFRFLPMGVRVKARRMLESGNGVGVASSAELEAHLRSLLHNDLEAFRRLSGIQYPARDAHG